MTAMVSLHAVIINNNYLPTTAATGGEIRGLIAGHLQVNSIKDLDPNNQFTVIAEGDLSPGKKRKMEVSSYNRLTTPAGFEVPFELAVVHFNAGSFGDLGPYRIHVLSAGTGSFTLDDRDTKYIVILFLDKEGITLLGGTGGTSILPLEITINGQTDQATVVKPDYEGGTPTAKQVQVILTGNEGNPLNLQTYPANSHVADLEITTNFKKKEEGLFGQNNNPPKVTIYPSDALGNIQGCYEFQNAGDESIKFPYSLTIQNDAGSTMASGLTGKHQFDVTTFRYDTYYGKYSLAITSAANANTLKNAAAGEYYSHITVNVSIL